MKPANLVIIMSDEHNPKITGARAAFATGKYVHYAAGGTYSPQLFDLEADPEELRDLAYDAACAKVLSECRERLYAICDPAEVGVRANKRQAELLHLNGGREAVIELGERGFSPPPGYPVVLG
jgi:choline-sulfatase